ncbi:GNAT family N-acetyltransferase [Candidatus Pacearchaeota archaeon]|nr:GNAT family N-acetyltransferase [Candidatus Pacearchaeota archaeon]
MPGEIEFVIKRNTPEIIKEKIKTRDIFNMEERGKIIGNIELNGDKLNNLYVHKDKLKQGIGEKLLLFIEDYAKKKGVTKFHFRSTPSAVTFYKKFGYKITKVEKTIQDGIEMTHTLMEKELK